MKKEEKEELVSKVLGEIGLFVCKGVQNVNHKPHPYMIGPRHIVYASNNHGVMLGEETCRKVHCSHPGCTSSYEDHTSDEVCFLQLTRDVDSETANSELKKLVDALEISPVDGFAFVETEEKFRMGDYQ